MLFKPFCDLCQFYDLYQFNFVFYASSGISALKMRLLTGLFFIVTTDWIPQRSQTDFRKC